nr:hypothetical protein [Paracoccus yeei]
MRAGVYDVPQLCQLDPCHARLIWRSVEGERFVRMLQGMDIPLTATQRGGFGNSKILSPEYRDPRRAYMVGRWLVEKATARLRRDGRVAGRFSLTVSMLAGSVWSRGVSCFPTQDSAFFLRLHRALWKALWRNGRKRRRRLTCFQLDGLNGFGVSKGRTRRQSRPAKSASNCVRLKVMAPSRMAGQVKLSASRRL